MGSIEIRKFEFTDEGQNYFALPDYVDKIVFNQIHIDGFPIFDEEYEKEFEAFSIRASDFDIKFHLLQTTTSDLGLTIEQFFTSSIDNHCLVAKVDYGRQFSGVVDGKVYVRKNWNKNEYDIKFSCYSFEDELKKWGDVLPVEADVISPAWHSYWNNSHFWNGNPGYVVFNFDDLDWTSKIGFEPYLVTELWALCLQQNKVTSATKWDLFEDCLKAFGLIFYTEITGVNFANKYQISFIFAFRNTGFIEDEVTVSSETFEYEIYKTPQVNKWQFVKYATGTGANEFLKYGIFFQKGETIPVRGIEYTYATGYYLETTFIQNSKYVIRDVVHIPGNELEITQADVNEIEFSQYMDCRFTIGGNFYQYIFSNFIEFLVLPGGSAKNYAFPAMWTKSGYQIQTFGILGLRWGLILNGVNAIYEYMLNIFTNATNQNQFLLTTSVVKKYNLEATYINGTINRIFNRSSIPIGSGRSENIILYKISNLELANRKADEQWRTLI